MKCKKVIYGLLMMSLLAGCGDNNSTSLSNNSSSQESTSKQSELVNSTSSKDSSVISSSSFNSVSSSTSSVGNVSSTSTSSNSISVSSSSKDDDDNKGYLKVEVPKFIYSNYPAKDIKYSFSNPKYSSELEYVISDERLIIENHKIYTTSNFEEPVNISILVISEYFDAIQFSINVSTFTGGINLETKVQYYENNIIKEENKGGTIFIGDSYFDGVTKETPPFWKDFYKDYLGEPKTFLMGISSQRIEHLEVTSERIVYPMAPKEIVMHIGFNDVHSGTFEVDEIYSRIVALVEEFKERLQDVKIYYTGVEPKKNGYLESSQYYYSSTVKAPALTQKMKDYANDKDWFVYVDTMSVFVEDGVIKEDSYLSSDLSHPTLEAYDQIRAFINEARGVENYVESDSAFNIKQYGSSSDINGSGRTFLAKDNSNLTNNYIVSGSLEIIAINLSNAHLQFRFSSNTRFLLWDSDSDGVVGLGYMASGSTKSDKTSGATLYDANNGLKLNWTIIVHEGKAYMYIDKELKENIDKPKLEYFNIGALQMDVMINNLDVTIKTENETKYTSLISEYGL